MDARELKKLASLLEKTQVAGESYLLELLDLRGSVLDKSTHVDLVDALGAVALKLMLRPAAMRITHISGGSAREVFYARLSPAYAARIWGDESEDISGRESYRASLKRSKREPAIV